MIRYMLYNTVHTILKRRGRLFSTLSLLLLMLTWGAGPAFAQTEDYSGTYYIASTPTSSFDADNPANNFYMAPTVGYKFYNANSNPKYQNDNNGQPFITTYQYRATNDASEAVWVIEKHPTLDGYYFIKHKSDNKYLTYNPAPFSNNGRVRVHLQDSYASDEEASLFRIDQLGNGFINIASKKAINTTGDQNKIFLNVNKGNKNSLVGDGDAFNSVNTGGIIGLWSENTANSVFYLEDYYPLPTITYNEDDLIEISTTLSGTIIYTTDGTKPTLQNGTEYTTPFEPDPNDNGNVLVKAIVIMAEDVTNVATFTTLVSCGIDHKRLIQSQNNAWNTDHFYFYMIPGDEVNNVLKVNTTSMFRPTMEWYFKYAGADNTTQYFYIVNPSSNGKYMCYDSSNGVYMDVFDSQSPDKFKFKIVESPISGTFNIKPKDNTKNLNKNSSNTSEKTIALHDKANDVNSIWKFVKKSVLERTAPFTVSDANSMTYYQLHNSSSGDHYIKAPASAGDFATITDARADQNTYWYFELADASTEQDWLDYFYIRNALTGEYLYFATEGNASDNNAAFKTSENNGEAGRYQFTWVRSADKDYYFIVPKILRDEAIGTVSTMNRNNTILRVQKVRATGSSAWSFVTDAFCHDPAISQAANGDVTITCPTTGTDFYYTLDGSEPVVPATGDDPESPTFKYTGTITPAIGSTGVKAIAVIASDHTVQSNVIELEFSPYTAPVITFNGINQAEINAGDGAAIYYTTDGNEPTVSGSSTNHIEISVSNTSTIKAIATHTGYLTSSVSTLTIEKVATPTSTLNPDNTITLSCATEGATLHYTLDGTTPSTNSPTYSAPLSAGVSGKTIKVLAVKANMLQSDIYTSTPVTIQCAAPQFRRLNATTVLLVCENPTDGVTFKISMSASSDGVNPTEPGEPITDVGNDNLIHLEGQTPITIKAIAYANGYAPSEIAERAFSEDINQDPDGTYLITSTDDYELFVTKVQDGGGAGERYRLTTDIALSTSPGNTTISTAFSGTFDGQGHTISGLRNPIFATVNGGTVRNLMLSDVNISGHSGNTGAIACSATGAARIYNVGILDGEVGGTGHTGGLVGDINGNARVINCFSYADITSGSDRAGIVGYNNVATTAATVETGTMVMNCMFYGDITTGGNISPVYGGVNISNLSGGLNTFNYYLYESPFSSGNHITANKYNSAISVKQINLIRFEYYRELLNSNKKLAAFYATGSADDAGSKMLKWVLETADRTIQNPKPYPVLKAQGYYPSIINYDTRNLADYSEANRNQGLKTGTLSVTITQASNAPTGATIGSGSSVTITLDRTDKDYAHFNYNYDKVQLPYYNDVGTKNYTGNKVVTGWKITAITASGDNAAVQGTFTESDTWGGYNFADRMTYAKDLYSVSGRVFSQGAYFDVPYGVTAIEIEPYWGNAAYLADGYYDYVYSAGYAGEDVEEVGVQITNDTYLSINGDNQKVYTSISGALSTLSGSTVYDNALVLIGNKHRCDPPSNESNKPFTMMSIDLDKDNEPDYSFIYHHDNRLAVSPIRFDFINVLGTAMAQKPNNATKLYNVAIFKPTGWFEITNTCLIHFVQFEYDNGGKSSAPLIILGGTFDQFTSTHGQNSGSGTYSASTKYIHVGGNAYFKNFSNGCHSEVWWYTPHIPISVTGGDYDGFYLSGIYQPNATVIEDDAECYISGGRFGEVAGAAQQQIDGNVQWQIYNADITEFYGGGLNAANPITGNITTNIYNSYVTTFCGGPKFGDMQKAGSISLSYLNNKKETVTREKTILTDRIVTTVAQGCTFGNYFGAGYGGTSFNRINTKDGNAGLSADFGGWTSDYTDKKGKYIAANNGIATDFDYEAFVWSTGQPAGRFYVKWASFSLAQTNDVNSTLTDCKITGNFYGGGNRGKVNGKATSILHNCNVTGDVFGAGFSAADATVDLRNGGFVDKVPQINLETGLFEEGTLSGTTTYTWTHTDNSITDGASAIATVGGENVIYTIQDLSTLGQVTEADLTITGTTTVGGSVFGGGEESATNGAIAVNIENGAITGNVFGGGDEGPVTGNPVITITKTDTEKATSITGSVYGGGNLAPTTGDPSVSMDNGAVSGSVFGGGLGSTATVTGNTTVAISGGTVGTDVYGGGSQGDVTGTVSVTISDDANVTGDVYGGGALANTNTVNEGDPYTSVSITGGTVRDVYGGGLGRLASGNDAAVAADVNGPVTVTIDGGDARYVFGCNNLNGSPKSSVQVVINSTDATTTQNGVKTYALQAVYGGGNLAHYNPTSPSNYPTVTVNGCETSIKDVFGGGNAAAVPYTNVTINGGDIDRVFIGGNGESGTAAHVGYLSTDDNPESGSYGAGTANATITGGTINKVFGGGNSKGIVRAAGTLNINKSSAEGACDMYIGEVYGGGNLANGAASLITIGSTGPIVTGENGHAAHPENIGTTLEGIGTVYGGANAADVTGNISLTINGGLISNIFGGNNTSGSVSGTIAVNIEKTCNDDSWYVGDVYGGGNIARYAGSPTVNVKNGTVSRNVYGGGNGDPDGNTQEAGSTGAPTVTIGDLTHTDTENNTYTAIVLGDVYGGGNAAMVTGDAAPTVLVQKCNTQVQHDVYGGGNAADVPATNVTMSGGTISGLFGGGHGDNTEGNVKAANVTGNVSVTVTGGTITQVFAGSNLNGSIGGTVTLNINKSSALGACDMIIGEVYGGGNQAAGNAGTITIGCTGTIVTGENGHAAHPENIGVSLEGIGTVYGGAKQADIGTSESPSNITLNIHSGMVANVFGGNNTSGTIHGTIEVNIEKNDETCGWYVGNVYGGGNLAPYTGSPVVNVKNGTVSGNVYGGGKGTTADITGSPVVTVGDLTPANSAYVAIVTGDVYGGGDAASVTGNTSVTLQKANSGAGRLYGGGNQAGISGNTVISMAAGSVTNAVYGGCNTTGTVGGTSTVTVTGGTIGTAFAQAPASVPLVLFGGGKGAGTSVTGQVTLNIGTKSGDIYTGSANIYGNVYGGSENGEVHAVNVNLYGNNIYGNVFGGGYQTASGKTAATNVNIILDGTAFDRTYNGMAQIFGANDQQGSPTGHVLIHVKRTVAVAGQTANAYYLAAVYGGGNEANYDPTDNIQSTEVLIEGCDETKIQNVYGGGNAAAVPAAEVWLFGSNIIQNLYGGGNGELGASHAAHVGFHRTNEGTDTYESGSGKTYVNLVGGTVTNVYGGSNSNGDIRGGTNILMPQMSDYHGSADIDDTDNCNLNATNIYGGGKNAPMRSGVNIVLGCMPDDWIDEIYAGAQAADVGGHVSLTIRSGKFGRVFGGNKDSGKLMGSITVNIEETGDCDVPIIIGELYGGGNLADYSVYGYKANGDPMTAAQLREAIEAEYPSASEGIIDEFFEDRRYNDPKLNVRAFTSIGAIYGGGLQAKVYGDPNIDINVVKGSHAAESSLAGNTGGTVSLPYPAHAAGEIGAIGNIYGGGNLATVYGNTSINIGTKTTVDMVTAPSALYTQDIESQLYLDVPVSGAKITGNIYGGGNDADIEGNTLINIGTVDLTGAGMSGTNVAGDIFGGGKGASTTVTGNVEINIGTNVSGTPVGYATIGGDVYGGSAFGAVNATKGANYESNHNDIAATTDKTTQVNIYGGSVTGSVFGGGEGQTSPISIVAQSFGDATVNIEGGTVGTAVYGGSNINGVLKAKATVNITGGTIGADPGAGAIQDVVFGGGKGQPTIVDGDVEVNIGALDGTTPTGSAIIWGHVYGGSALGSVNGTTATSNTHTTHVNLYQGTVNGDLYGGGLGQTSSSIAANVYGLVTVTTKGGTATNVFGSNNLYGAPQQTVTVQIDGGTFSGNVYGGGNLAAYGTALAPGTATVNMTGGQAVNVFGGGYGASAIVTGNTAVTISGGTVTNNVYGGGDAANLTGNAGVTVSGGTVSKAVYGGGNMANVSNNSTVNITGGTISGDNTSFGSVRGAVFGGGFGNTTLVGGTVNVNINGNSTITGDVYGGSAKGKVNTTDGSSLTTDAVTNVTVSGGTINGDVYGGGLGDNTYAADVYGPVTVTTSGQVINSNGVLTSATNVVNVFGGNNIKGTPKSTIAVNIGGGIISSGVYGGGNVAPYTGNPAVSMTGGMAKDVFGGGLGSSAIVTGNPQVTLSGGDVSNNVYGGGSEADVIGSTTVSMPQNSTARVDNNLFGGGSEADVTGSVTVTIADGWVTGGVYGGGAFANTNTDNWNATKEADVYGKVSGVQVGTTNVSAYYEYDSEHQTYNLSTDGTAVQDKTYYQQIHVTGTWADGKTSATNTTTVTLTGGTVGDVYGGGLGQIADDAVGTEGQPGYMPALTAREAMVYGDVSVTVNGAAFKKRDRLPDGDKDPVPTSGRVFGCNNQNGTPMGNVTVTVNSTVQLNDMDQRVPGHQDNKYDIHSVYGGGNLAHYLPHPGKETKVIIDGCGETSIEKVFGGGNSASVPSTDVTIYGSYAIGYAFGGGNGADKIPQRDGSWEENDGAPVNGDAKIVVLGGKIGDAFSGSDTKGTIYGNATILINGKDGYQVANSCPIKITNTYGAARGADIDHDVIFTVTGCGDDNIENVFAGSYDANIRGSVTLNIKSGVFKNVYGGNDHGGTIGGTITVNVEEDDPNHQCKPIIIQNLYGGGREATYPGTGAYHNSAPSVPYTQGKITVNLKSFTRIDNVYGGSLKAPVIGSTEVNVNLVKGDWAGQSVTLPKEYAYIPNIVFGAVNGDNITGTINNAIGTIGNVFGGADEGMVTGNAVVNIGTITSYDNGTVPVLGAHITGDVFGGGNNADIRGNTYVNISAAHNANGVPSGTEVDLTTNTGYAGVKIKGSVYGGGNMGSVGTFDHINDAKPTALTQAGTGTSTVTILGDAEIGPDNLSMITADGKPIDKGHVFGASRGVVKDPKNDPTIKFRTYVYNSNVTIGGNAFVKGSVYGGSENGHVLNNTHVIIKGECQIGNGYVQMNDDGTYLNTPLGVNRPYTADEWEAGHLIITNDDRSELRTLVGTGNNALYSTSLPECASWTYEANGKPYDVYDYVDPTAETKVPKAATDGHTFYGNVFGGGSGYYPYAQNPNNSSIKAIDPSYADGLWLRSAGIVEGNTVVDILGGHILTSVYGGNEQTDVYGSCTVNMSGGTVGVPRTPEQIAAHPVTCYVFGGGKGDQRINFNIWTNVGSTSVNITDEARIYGSVFGGGEDGHVLGNAVTTIGSNAANADNSKIKIGTIGTSTVDGNIFGGGRGFSGTALTAGVVSGNVTVNIYGGYMMGSVFGGGRIASVGTYLVHPELEITEDGDGNVTALPGTSDINPQYGSLIPGTDHGNITVNIHGGTIGSTDTADELGISVGDVFAGCKGGFNKPELGLAKNTTLTITGGTINHNVYGGGEMGSLGKITAKSKHDVTKREYYDADHEYDGAFYDFGISWPYEFTYSTEESSNGLATISITGNTQVKGDVYGSSKGHVMANRFDEALLANVRETSITIGSTTGDNQPIIGRSVYGGGEDGHVYDNTTVIINNGSIGQSVFGGGNGTGTYVGTQWTITSQQQPLWEHGSIDNATLHSIIAGKVYGNTNVTVNGGTIAHNVFGGGNLGSVGIGNYAGGTDDYMTIGFGELPPKVNDAEGPLWTNTLFMGSGKATVKINSGVIGTAGGYEEDELNKKFPTGNVFGSSRGIASYNVGRRSPRYMYVPDFFLGYCNETEVTIGSDQYNVAPVIYGSVYGGGQDGHVRRDAKVIINKGTIGLEYNSTNTASVNESDLTSMQWIGRGNVYGAGSGLGTYLDNGVRKYNFSSGSVTCATYVQINGGTIYQNVYGGGALASIGPPNIGFGYENKEATGSRKSYSYSQVEINAGATIGTRTNYETYNYGGNVYGASRGDKTLNYQGEDPDTYATDIWSTVNVTGGTIAGSIFGGGEAGNLMKGVEVNISGGTITHDVYGGGALANTNMSRQEVGTGTGIYTYPNTTVNLTGGSMDRVYGGGLGRLHFDNNHIPNHEGSNAVKAMSGNVTINLNQGVENSAPGAIVNKIFGANNFNGTPEGHVKVHVYATQNKYTDALANTNEARNKFSHPRQEDNEDTKTYLGRLLAIASNGNGGYVDGVTTSVLAAANTVYGKENPTDDELTTAINNVNDELVNLYDVQVVYGGGDLAAYVPTDALLDYTTNKAKVDAAYAEVIIDGCDLTSIYQVYGGGNAASTPGTRVTVNGTYEIYEVFGGGNGKDPYQLKDGGVEYTYINPGANIGYHDYTYFVADGTIEKQFNPVDYNASDGPTLDASSKQAREQNYAYGSGISTTEIRGGTMHAVYGGSNEKGNIRSTALSVYEDSDDDCPIKIDETYGGGKDAAMDGEINLSLDCAKDMDMIFGGAKNADINNNITLNITNGSYNMAFGGNNTGGAVYGSITVNIEERGCVPIEIGELYGGGYLAPYSIYGYEKENGAYKYYEVDANNQFIPLDGGGYKVGNKDNGKLMPLEAGQTGASATPVNDPRINVISATRIGAIYGGGYKAKMVGSPYINVNMQDGKMEVYKKTIGNETVYVDTDYDQNHQTYTPNDNLTETDENDPTKQKYFIPIDLGTVGSIYGGGYLADVVGDTHIDIGTGSWITGWTNGTPTTEDLQRNDAVITGEVFGGGDNADVTGNTHINIANGHIYFSVYGGGKMGSVGTITGSTKHSDLSSEFALSWPYEFEYKTGTGTTNINITGGRIGFTGKDNFVPDAKYGYWKWRRKKAKETDVLDAGETRLDNGDVYGGGKGIAGERYSTALIANVKEARVTINYSTTPSTNETSYSSNIDLSEPENNYIAGSVYGGGEDGHVYDNTYVNIYGGLIGHSVYGGGKGKGEFDVVLIDWKKLDWEHLSESAKNTYKNTSIDEVDPQYKKQATITGVISGKIYGNTNVIMTDGKVIRNVYGGGNLGSVGKGNYAGGTDDYTYYAPSKGYGERLNGPIWVADNDFMSSGKSTVTITGGTLGTASGDKDDLPTGNVFGGARGTAPPNVPNDLSPRHFYDPEFYMGYINESVVTIGTQGQSNEDAGQTGKAPRIYGSVYGGGQDGHVRRETNVTIYSGEIGNVYNTANRLLVGTLTPLDPQNAEDSQEKYDARVASHSDSTHLQWLFRGNVYGAGSGIGKYDPNGKDEDVDEGNDDLHSTSAGSVTHNTTINIKGGIIHRNVYGGGSLATVGPPYMGHTDNGVRKDPSEGTEGTCTGQTTLSVVNIESKVGDDESFALGYGGNVFGASRGANNEEKLHLEPVNINKYATTFYNKVNIKQGADVLGNVFGGGEAGLVFKDAKVNVANFDGALLSSATIGRSVFGGGDQADVQGNTYVNVGGGWIKKSIYGGGNMGSVGKLTGTPVVHNTEKTETPGAGALYDFGLSWPVDIQFAEGTGTTNVTITGGRIGITGKDVMITGGEKEDNGDIYGGSKGEPAERYEEAYYANVRNTVVTIDYPSDLVYNVGNLGSYIDNNGTKILIKQGIPAIHGSVYGGGENGHVLDSTKLIINNGLIGHGVYGGGKGKDTYSGELIDYSTRNTTHTTYQTQVASIIAGKVYGNTNITMNGGYVLRNIYGGGNLASVGKGNYAGGTDDYSLEGYGELPPKDGNADGPLWANDDFKNSGICRVTIKGGTVGYYNDAALDLSAFTKDDLPTGNVFGSCRGMSAPNYNDISPRYLYFPEFFYGYVNQTIVTIGDANGGPTILGSVYGGGQDGHVRRSSKVVINNGTIGLDYDNFKDRISESNQFLDRGNVYGAGSGVGQFSYDVRQLIDSDHPELGYQIVGTQTGYNYSSGSVTGTTSVQINNGTIYQNVYGGGALASVGPPNIGAEHGLGFDEYQTTAPYDRPAGFSAYNNHLSTSSCNIVINGGYIGNAAGYAAAYGGNVYGASRGNIGGLNLGATSFLHATTIWTNVEAKNGHIFGNVFGGGQMGEVKHDTRVVIGGAEQTPAPQSPAQPRAARPQAQSAAQSAANAQPVGNGQSPTRNIAVEAPVNRSITTRQAQ